MVNKIIRILSTQVAAIFHVEEYKNEYKRVPSLMSSSESDNSALSVREIMSRVMLNWKYFGKQNLATRSIKWDVKHSLVYLVEPNLALFLVSSIYEFEFCFSLTQSQKLNKSQRLTVTVESKTWTDISCIWLFVDCELIRFQVDFHQTSSKWLDIQIKTENWYEVTYDTDC